MAAAARPVVGSTDHMWESWLRGRQPVTSASEAMRGMGLADPMYTEPFVDVDEWRDDPVRHRYVHGGFEGTDCRFSMYLPDASRYQGRFFHPLSAVPGSEHSSAG